MPCERSGAVIGNNNSQCQLTMAKVSPYVTGITVHHMPDQHRAILQKAMKQSPGENPGTEEDGQPYHAELQDLRS